jgi:precorrin-6A synthase
MQPSPPPPQRRVDLIGLGTGAPGDLSRAAVEAIRGADVFFLLEKRGRGTESLGALRRRILESVRPDGGYRLVEAESPERTVGPATRDGYADGIARWRDARSTALVSMIDSHLAPGETGAFLVLGDPCLYDGTIGTMQALAAADPGLDFTVIPGVSSVQALAAAHRIVLNRVGESVTITTARLLDKMPPETVTNHVVMLDGRAAFLRLRDEPLEIYWGAYLGAPEQILMAGRLPDIADAIADAIEQARARHGWIMDTYLLRRV